MKRFQFSIRLLLLTMALLAILSATAGIVLKLRADEREARMFQLQRNAARQARRFGRTSTAPVTAPSPPPRYDPGL
jgi:type II secretory pathway pseudopilin PulG